MIHNFLHNYYYFMWTFDWWNIYMLNIYNLYILYSIPYKRSYQSCIGDTVGASSIRTYGRLSSSVGDNELHFNRRQPLRKWSLTEKDAEWSPPRRVPLLNGILYYNDGVHCSVQFKTKCWWKPALSNGAIDVQCTSLDD